MERKDRILRVGRIREEEFLADLINAWNSTTCLIHECPSEIPKLGPIATRLAQTMENFQRAKQCNLKIDCFRDDLGRVSFQVKAKDEIGFLKWKRKQE
jgi:hypothetical protein